MTNPPETANQTATGNDDVYDIPIDWNAARLHRFVLFCNFAASLGVPLFPFAFVFRIIWKAAQFDGSSAIDMTQGEFLMKLLGFGLYYFPIFILVMVAIYFLFAKWLIEWQVDALNYRIEGRTLRVDSGVFFLKRKGVPLDRIIDFALVQGPLMRAARDMGLAGANRRGRNAYARGDADRHRKPGKSSRRTPPPTRRRSTG